MSIEQRRSAFVAGLREFADLLEREPGLPVPSYDFRLSLYTFADRFTDAVHALGGHREKTADDHFFNVERRFGPIIVEVYTGRDDVCERVQIGTQIVEREEIVSPAVTKTVTVEEPVYEWRCAPVLEHEGAVA